MWVAFVYPTLPIQSGWMTRELLILWAGRHDRPAWREVCAGFEKRISRFATLRCQPVRVRGGGDRLTAEGVALLQRLPEESWPVALDVGGAKMDSVAFSRFLTKLHHEWSGPVAFLVGSDLGLSPDVPR